MKNAFLVLAFCAATVPAFADDARALAVLAQAKAATGGAALDKPSAFRETGVIERDGKKATYETFGNLQALQSAGSQSFQGTTARSGFDGQAAWHIAPDGRTQVSSDPETLKSERLGAYLTVSGYLYPDRFPATFVSLGQRKIADKTFDVVSATPANADPVDLWFGATSHRLEHIEMAAGEHTVKGDVSDYHLIDGTYVGYALKLVQDGHEIHLNLADFAYVPNNEALFRNPVPAVK